MRQSCRRGCGSWRCRSCAPHDLHAGHGAPAAHPQGLPARRRYPKSPRTARWGLLHLAHGQQTPARRRLTGRPSARSVCGARCAPSPLRWGAFARCLATLGPAPPWAAGREPGGAGRAAGSTWAAGAAAAARAARGGCALAGRRPRAGRSGRSGRGRRVGGRPPAAPRTPRAAGRRRAWRAATPMGRPSPLAPRKSPPWTCQPTAAPPAAAAPALPPAASLPAAWAPPPGCPPRLLALPPRVARARRPSPGLGLRHNLPLHWPSLLPLLEAFAPRSLVLLAALLPTLLATGPLQQHRRQAPPGASTTAAARVLLTARLLALLLAPIRPAAAAPPQGHLRPAHALLAVALQKLLLLRSLACCILPQNPLHCRMPGLDAAHPAAAQAPVPAQIPVPPGQRQHLLLLEQILPRAAARHHMLQLSHRPVLRLSLRPQLLRLTGTRRLLRLLPAQSRGPLWAQLWAWQAARLGWGWMLGWGCPAAALARRPPARGLWATRVRGCPLSGASSPWASRAPRRCALRWRQATRSRRTSPGQPSPAWGRAGRGAEPQAVGGQPRACNRQGMQFGQTAAGASGRHGDAAGRRRHAASAPHQAADGAEALQVLAVLLRTAAGRLARAACLAAAGTARPHHGEVVGERRRRSQRCHAAHGSAHHRPNRQRHAASAAGVSGDCSCRWCRRQGGGGGLRDSGSKGRRGQHGWDRARGLDEVHATLQHSRHSTEQLSVVQPSSAGAASTAQHSRCEAAGPTCMHGPCGSPRC